MKKNSISMIRCIAMCMIVSCHFLQGMGNELAYWMNLGVQIFLCMSGYLYGGKTIEQTSRWYLKQYIKIMKPMWILLTIIIGIKLVIGVGESTIVSVGLSYLGVAGFGTLQELTHTWFITYILLCYLLTPLLQQIDIIQEDKTLLFIVKLGVILGILEVLYLSRITNFLPQYVACYIVGYYMSKRQKEKKDSHEQKCITIGVILLAMVLLPMRMYLQYGIIDNVESETVRIVLNHIVEWHHSLLGIALFFGMLWVFEKMQVKSGKIIAFFEQKSYCIYLVHQIFILNTFSMLHITNILVLNIIFALITIIISAQVLDFLQKKIVIRKI